MSIAELSDTALLTAYARAIEDQRPNRLFSDPFALALAGEKGAGLATQSGATFETLANSIACRTAVFNELLLQLLKNNGIDLVMNLAAGLDARPWRLDLAPGLR